MKAAVLSCHFSWYCLAYPKFSETTNHQYPWKGSCDFAFLQVVVSILLDIHWSYQNMQFWAGSVRHSLSANQVVRCFKLKKLKKDTRYQVDSLLSLKLEKILCYYGLWPQNTLGESVCRTFYFWLVWLVKLNTGVLSLILVYLFDTNLECCEGNPSFKQKLVAKLIEVLDF